MLTSLNQYMASCMKLRQADNILLAVSGGIDSVVLLDLMIKSGYPCGIAHCNFGLRGEESDLDEHFVSTLAISHGIPFFKRKFNTEEYSGEHGVSIQMAARALRYEWFEEIRSQNAYHWIATAHNQDDVLETFIINLTRGTGIRGLSGIRAVQGKIIRPLLIAGRESIANYAKKEGLSFREDSSNASVKYIRNRIRHKIIPMLEEINPSFKESLSNTINKLAETEKLYDEEINRQKKSLLIIEGENTIIDTDRLQDFTASRSLLYEILSQFNFPSHSIEGIWQSIEGPSGKQFISKSHRIVKDRRRFIVSPLPDHEFRRYYIEDLTEHILEPVDLEFIILDHTPGFQIPTDPDTACLDYEKLLFPLMIRSWESGDSFQPLGMNGFKKLSDFLIDEKVSLPEKEETWLLTSGDDIVWIIGRRIDNRYKITDSTSQVLLIKLSS